MANEINHQTNIWVTTLSLPQGFPLASVEFSQVDCFQVSAEAHDPHDHPWCFKEHGILELSPFGNELLYHGLGHQCFFFLIALHWVAYFEEEHLHHSLWSAVIAQVQGHSFLALVWIVASQQVTKVGSIECPPITASGPCRPNKWNLYVKKFLWTTTSSKQKGVVAEGALNFHPHCRHHSINICSNAQVVLHNICIIRCDLLWLHRCKDTPFWPWFGLSPPSRWQRWAPLNARTRQPHPTSPVQSQQSPKTKTKEILQCITMGICSVAGTMCQYLVERVHIRVNLGPTQIQSPLDLVSTDLVRDVVLTRHPLKVGMPTMMM